MGRGSYLCQDEDQLDDTWPGSWPGSGIQSPGGTLSGQVVVLAQPAPAPLIFPVLTWLIEPLLSVDLGGECEAQGPGSNSCLVPAVAQQLGLEPSWGASIVSS